MRPHALAIAAAVCWLSANTAGATPAKDEAEARRMFEQATALADSGRWDQACPVFAAAHALFPTGGTAMNVARCHEDAGRKSEALALYDYVLRLPEQPAARVQVASDRKKALRAELAATREEPVIAPKAKTESPVAPPPTASESDGIGYAPAAIAFAVGGAGLVAGAVVGGLALAQMGEVRDSCNGDICPAAQAAAADEARDKSWGANAAFIVGGVGVAAGIVLAIVAGVTEPGETPPVRADARGLFITF